jgi:DtxR family Mn-dependent transcriptional regulator
VEISLSLTEENYLKAIYHLSEGGEQEVSTNALSEQMDTKPATVSDMIRKLSKKNVIVYEKYKGVNISDIGKKLALHIIRKHRLWEVFLVQKLNFNWDEVHDIAEQLEHIVSPELVKRLDDYLGNPVIDPHGDPIPDSQGQFHVSPAILLADMPINSFGIFVAVSDNDPRLLQYLDKINLKLTEKITVIDKVSFDGSMKIHSKATGEVFISEQISQLLSVRILDNSKN